MTECKDHGACPSEQMEEALLQDELKKVPDWSLSKEPNKISREFKFKNFAEALAFTNKVSEIAEAMNHHPDILLKWGSVKVDYWTHNAGGLTHMDFDAAKKIDQLI